MTISDEAKTKVQTSATTKKLEEYQVPKCLSDIQSCINLNEVIASVGTPRENLQSSPASAEYNFLVNEAFKQAQADNGIENIYKDIILNQEKGMKVNDFSPEINEQWD